MTVQSEITRISGAKTAIASAVEASGVTVPDGTKVDALAPLVQSIVGQFSDELDEIIGADTTPIPDAIALADQINGEDVSGGSGGGTSWVDIENLQDEALLSSIPSLLAPPTGLVDKIFFVDSNVTSLIIYGYLGGTQGGVFYLVDFIAQKIVRSYSAAPINIETVEDKYKITVETEDSSKKYAAAVFTDGSSPYSLTGDYPFGVSWEDFEEVLS